MRWRERLSKKEASGAVTLIFAVLIIQVIIFLFNLPDKRIKRDSPSANIAEESLLLNVAATEKGTFDSMSIPENRRLPEQSVAIKPSGRKDFGRLFEFDPNIVTLTELVQLGLSEKQASTIINYRSKGGVFQEREDFLKMYVVSEEFYERVKEFIVISDIDGRSNIEGGSIDNESGSNNLEGSGKSANTIVLEKDLPLLEINRADSLDLLDLPGIGPYYASRIVRYRDRTGGFISKEQLKEISGIDEERYSMFEARVYADTSLIYKADLNFITTEELSSNPYIGSYLARAIVRFREQSGTIYIKMLFDNKIVDQRKYELLRYYFL